MMYDEWEVDRISKERFQNGMLLGFILGVWFTAIIALVYKVM